jgi:nucleoside-diphosphate-sugar epimerase
MNGIKREGGYGTDAAPNLQVIFGTGPVGFAAARFLLEKGLPVRMVNRSGTLPDHAFPLISPELRTRLEVKSADAMDQSAVRSVIAGASHAYHCANVGYHLWEKLLPTIHSNLMRAAISEGSVLGVAENLYMYARGLPVIDDKARVDPPSRKGRLMQRLHERLPAAGVRDGLKWASVRASDFYGPGATEQSLFGTVRFLDPLFAGKRPLLWGNIDTPHTFTNVEDYGRALAVAALTPKAQGDVWIVPNDRTVTTRTLAEVFFRAAGFTNGRTPQIRRIPRTGFALMGLVNPLIREILEVLYQKEEPYVVNGDRFRDTFGFKPTPIEDGVRRTLEWYRAAY